MKQLFTYYNFIINELGGNKYRIEFHFTGSTLASKSVDNKFG